MDDSDCKGTVHAREVWLEVPLDFKDEVGGEAEAILDEKGIPVLYATADNLAAYMSQKAGDANHVRTSVADATTLVGMFGPEILDAIHGGAISSALTTQVLRDAIEASLAARFYKASDAAPECVHLKSGEYLDVTVPVVNSCSCAGPSARLRFSFGSPGAALPSPCDAPPLVTNVVDLKLDAAALPTPLCVPAVPFFGLRIIAGKQVLEMGGSNSSATELSFST
jgi:hypothetical protein